MYDFTAVHCLLHRGGVTHNVRGEGAGILGRFVHDDASSVNQEHPLNEVRNFIDEVTRKKDSPWMFGVVREQTVIEDLPRNGINSHRTHSPPRWWADSAR